MKGKIWNVKSESKFLIGVIKYREKKKRKTDRNKESKTERKKKERKIQKTKKGNILNWFYDESEKAIKIESSNFSKEETTYLLFLHNE